MVGSNTSQRSADAYYKPKLILIHRDYNPKGTVNDVALIKTTQPISFSPNVKPINVNSDQMLDVKLGVLAGWGLLDYDGDFPDNLQYIYEDIVPQDECITAHYPIPIYISHICGRNTAGRGACGGDSGSPLVSKGKQIGIASWIRRPCGSNPDVYVNVAFYSNWIKYIMNTY